MRILNRMFIIEFLAGLLVTFILGWLGTLSYLDSHTTIECTDTRSVVSINSVRYRTVYAELEGGIELELNQPTIEIGDTYCVATTRTIKTFFHTSVKKWEMGSSDRDKKA